MEYKSMLEEEAQETLVRKIADVVHAQRSLRPHEISDLLDEETGTFIKMGNEKADIPTREVVLAVASTADLRLNADGTVVLTQHFEKHRGKGGE